MILSDSETKVDLLNSESIAETIVSLIREHPESPITVGVHGDWGAGKSSVLEMIEAKLAKIEKTVCIKFNGWRYQGFEDAKIALLEGIVTELVEKQSIVTKAMQEAKDVFERIDWMKVAKKTGGILVTAFTGIPPVETIHLITNGLKGLMNNPGKISKENVETIYSQAASLLKPKDANKNIPKEINDFRKAFDKLLKKADINQLVILVDDLDRCLPDTAIETLEAIRLFVFTSNTAFVIAADEGMIEYAVKRHFPDLPDNLLQQMYTRNYLEKLIQVPFRIPVLGEFETKTYITLLLIGNEIGEKSTEYNDLISEARKRLKKPWEGKLIDLETVQHLFGEKAKQAQNALLISNQVGPILASGTKGNPRQIKRFLNTLILRQKAADAKGFGELILLPVLAKLMLAERFIPDFFEQLAYLSAKSPTGICEEIVELETIVKNENGKLQKRSGLDIKIVNNWMLSKDINSWVEIEPALKIVDLRPYLFIAKDKKDYFGSSHTLGHLTLLVEKLLGKRLSVNAYVSEIKQLSSSDADEVFGALRSKILNDGDFSNEPQGVAGLTLMAKLHPQLAKKLITFLEAIPPEKIGIWALKGWDEVIVGEDAKTLDNLIETWAEKGGASMKSAAARVKKLK